MKIASIWVQAEGVTIWYEGADSQSDYFPAIHRTTQRNALRHIAEDGTAAGCTVTTSNHRDFDKPDGPDELRAQRFARKIGVPYKPQIHFPHRKTGAEAAADAAVVPGAVVVYGHGGWVDVDGHQEHLETTFHATIEPNGQQIVSPDWINVAPTPTREQQRIALGVELARKAIDPEDLAGCVADTFGEGITPDDIRGTFRAWKAERANLEANRGSVAP